VPFVIRSGEGIVARLEDQRRRAGDVRAEVSQKLIMIDPSRDFPEELLAALRASYQVTLRHSLSSAFADLSTPSGAVLIEVRRDSVNDALTLVRELRRAGNNSPVVLVTHFMLRADDRARALRAGADDFLAGDLHPLEFLARIDAIIERGHVVRSHIETEAPLLMQPRSGDGPQLLDATDFRSSIQSRLAGDGSAFFTLVLLRPERSTQVGRLASLVLSGLRVDGGDLVGTLDDAVAVYLHAARRKDVPPFVERVREKWQARGEGEISIEIASHPLKRERVVDLLASEMGNAADGPAPRGVGTGQAEVEGR
jgi:DNA-binding NarL/FixJ family response regulator